MKPAAARKIESRGTKGRRGRGPILVLERKKGEKRLFDEIMEKTKGGFLVPKGGIKVDSKEEKSHGGVGGR